MINYVYDERSNGYVAYNDAERGIIGQGMTKESALENLNEILRLYKEEDENIEKNVIDDSVNENRG